MSPRTRSVCSHLSSPFNICNNFTSPKGDRPASPPRPRTRSDRGRGGVRGPNPGTWQQATPRVSRFCFHRGLQLRSERAPRLGEPTLNHHNHVKCLSLLSLLCVLSCSGDSEPESVETNPNHEKNIPGWFYSNQLQSNRRVYLHLPRDYDPNAGKSYPTLYLLDANWYFDGSHSRISGGGIVEVVTQLADTQAIPEMIMIGIGILDLAGTQVRGQDFHSPNTVGFLRFITEELVPEVDRRCNTDTQTSGSRVLIGHSSGGYFSTHALFESDPRGSNLVENFISLSILQNGDFADIIGEERQFFESTQADQVLNLGLFMGVGGNEEERFLSAYNSLLANLLSRGYRGFRIAGSIYPGHDHGSYIKLAVQDGLLFLFEDYPTRGKPPLH